MVAAKKNWYAAEARHTARSEASPMTKRRPAWICRRADGEGDDE
jgi:hypothetical protein